MQTFPLDSDDEDAERLILIHLLAPPVFPCSSVIVFAECFIHSGVLSNYDGALSFPTEYFTSWLQMQHSRLLGHTITYQMTTSDTLNISYFTTVLNNQNAMGIDMNVIGNYVIDSVCDTYKFPNSLIA
jgi:hypothetical protein